ACGAVLRAPSFVGGPSWRDWQAMAVLVLPVPRSRCGLNFQGDPMQRQDTPSKVIGYLLWVFGFLGAHRFYYGKPVTGTIWFFTLGLLFIGWIIDLFLIPSMDREADLRFTAGDTDYNVAWILLTFLGVFG